MFRGDFRYADRLGDYISDAYYRRRARRRRAGSRGARARSTATRSTRPTGSPTTCSNISARATCADVQPEMLALTAVRPLNHFSGFHTFYPVLASGRSAAPFRNVQDYENNLTPPPPVRRPDRPGDRPLPPGPGLGRGRDQAHHPQRHRPARHPAARRARGLALSTARSQNFPEGVPEADRARLRAELLRGDPRPASSPPIAGCATSCSDEYLPRARDGVGLVSHARRRPALCPPDREEHDAAADRRRGPQSRPARGRAHPRRDGRDPHPDRLHRHARPVLRVHPHRPPLRAGEPRVRCASGYYAIGRRVDARIREYFSTIPRSPARDPRGRGLPRAQRGRRLLSGRHARRHAARASSTTTPTTCPRGGPRAWRRSISTKARPAIISRSCLAAENEELPAFMRFGGNTAFVEGWALYAETLWDELGMETDPYQRFGGLNDEMLRAMRLVVDTGIHAKGWTRDQAIQYMLDNSGMSRDRGGRRGRALHRHSRPGARLQDRPAHDPAAARRGRARRSAAASTSGNSTPRC